MKAKGKKTRAVCAIQKAESQRFLQGAEKLKKNSNSMTC